jgi:hypothetical protein
MINDLLGDLVEENDCEGQQADSLILTQWHPNEE